MYRETARNTALIIIDMQNDFLHPEGLFSSMGYNVTEMRELNPTIHNVLELSPARGLFAVHTRQGCRADLSDLPPAMMGRSKNGETEFGSPGPMGRFLVHGEKRHDNVQEFQPRENNTVVDKVGSGAFCGTDLDLILWCRNLVFTGTSADACIHSANRTTIDTGNVSLLLEDCKAATVRSNHFAAVSTIKQEGRYFGSVGSSQAFPGGT